MDALWLRFPMSRKRPTDGADEAEALVNASDCLTAALIGYIRSCRPVPRPSPARGRRTIALPPLVAAKLALYSAMLEQLIINVDLAARMQKSESEVRRLLDLDHRSDIGQIEAALAELGKRLEIRVRDAA
jgi:antitoxin HicB